MRATRKMLLRREAAKYRRLALVRARAHTEEWVYLDRVATGSAGHRRLPVAKVSKTRIVLESFLRPDNRLGP